MSSLGHIFFQGQSVRESSILYAAGLVGATDMIREPELLSLTHEFCLKMVFAYPGVFGGSYRNKASNEYI